MKCLNLSTIHCICYIICKLTFDFHFFFFFLITEKNLLHAIVRKNVFQKFSAIIREGGTFIISNFKVIMINKYYRLVSNDLNIISLLTTSVKECNEESELIPIHAFEFATYDCINSRLNDNSYLTSKSYFTSPLLYFN